MSGWGKRGDNPNDKPKFPWIVKGNRDMFNSGGNNVTKTIATKKGWAFRWPWGDEVLVGIGGLVTDYSGSKSPSTSASASKSPSASPSVSASASKSPSASASPSASPSVTASASASPSASPSVTPSASASPSASPSITASASKSPSASPSPTTST